MNGSRETLAAIYYYGTTFRHLYARLGGSNGIRLVVKKHLKISLQRDLVEFDF